MPERLSVDQVRELLPEHALSEQDAEALAAIAAAMTRAVAAFPYAELRMVEPPLRSLPPAA
jgi:hypothetical protein